MQTDTHFWLDLAQFFLEWKFFGQTVVERIKTHILCSVNFSQKSSTLWDRVEKYYRARQATYGKMAHAYFIHDTQSPLYIFIYMDRWAGLYVSMLHRVT